MNPRQLEAAAAHGAQAATQVAQFHRLAVEHQLALDVGQRRPRRMQPRGDGRSRFAGPARVARHVGQPHPFEPGRDAELARPLRGPGAGRSRRAERKPPQIAAHLEVHCARPAGLHRALDVLPHARRQAQRQVARHARGQRIAQAPIELEHARQAPCLSSGVPGGLEFALGIVVGEPDLAGPQLDARRRAAGAGIDAPVQAAAQALQRDARLFEHARELQRTVAQRERRLAAALAGRQLDVGPLQARAPGLQAGAEAPSAGAAAAAAASPSPRRLACNR
ncbi:hypothetical protein Y694_04645 [Methylibium sp. T29-B]|nr:hypothetical protein Y694_04645 [Methylibium sp. T29-B]